MKKKNKARGRKARGRKTRGDKPKEPAIDLSTFIVSPEDRDGFREAIRETAANSVAEFPKELVLDITEFGDHGIVRLERRTIYGDISHPRSF